MSFGAVHARLARGVAEYGMGRRRKPLLNRRKIVIVVEACTGGIFI